MEGCVHLDPEKGMLYVNLPGVEAKLRDAGLQMYFGDALTKALRAHPAYVRHGLNYRFPAEVSKLGSLAKQKRVFTFTAAKI